MNYTSSRKSTYCILFRHFDNYACHVFFMFKCCLLTYFKINYFPKENQEHYLSTSPDRTSVLTLVQTVCKMLLAAKNVTSKEIDYFLQCLIVRKSAFPTKIADFSIKIQCPELLKVTTHSNNRNSKSSREVILGSVRL